MTGKGGRPATESELRGNIVFAIAHIPIAPVLLVVRVHLLPFEPRQKNEVSGNGSSDVIA
jgi:hypothetical protein